MNKNYYETLGVDKTADQDTIKKAFRDLSMEHHPDKGGDEEKFKEIAEEQHIPINTVQGRYRYGLDKLRTILRRESKK